MEPSLGCQIAPMSGQGATCSNSPLPISLSSHLLFTLADKPKPLLRSASVRSSWGWELQLASLTLRGPCAAFQDPRVCYRRAPFAVSLSVISVIPGYP